jgi:hypothetical protein
MRILTLKRLIGLAAIGGVAYAHKQRGGQWNLASIKDTLRHLWQQAETRIGPLKREMRDTLERSAHTSEPSVRGRASSDQLSRSYSEYITNRRKDDAGPH